MICPKFETLWIRETDFRGSQNVLPATVMEGDVEMKVGVTLAGVLALCAALVAGEGVTNYASCMAKSGHPLQTVISGDCLWYMDFRVSPIVTESLLA